MRPAVSEQELAIWKEQRDDAKLRKGGSRVGVTAVAAGAGAEGEGVDGREQTSEIKAAVKVLCAFRHFARRKCPARHRPCAFWRQAVCTEAKRRQH